MNNEIDSLSFKVNVTGISMKTVKAIQALSSALLLLGNTAKRVDLSELRNLIFISNFKVPAGIGASLSSMGKGLEKVTNALAKADFAKLSQLKAPINIFQISNNNVRAMQEGAKALGSVAEAQEKILNKQKNGNKKGVILGGNQKQIRKEIASSKELQQLAKQTGQAVTQDGKKSPSYYEKPNALVKTLRRIKLIAFIKLIRGALNAIIKGFQTGIQQLAIYSKNMNKTMSQMITAFDKMNASIALVAQPFIEMLMPIINALSDSLIEMANTISKANAVAKGLSTYTRISASYAKDYAQSMQQGSLFSFDTFETLNAQDTPYEEAEVGEDVSDVQDLANTINLIKEAGETIAKLMKVLLPGVGKIFKAIEPILDIVIEIGNESTEAIIEPLSGFLDLIADILYLISPIIKDILGTLKPINDLINNNLLPNVMKLLHSVLEPIMQLISKLPIAEIVNLISQILAPIMDGIGKVVESIVKFITPIFDYLIESISPIMDDIGEVIKVVGSIIADIVTNLSGFFTVFADIFDLLGAIFKGDFKEVGKNLEKLIKDIFQLIADLFMAIIRSALKIVVYIAEALVNGLIKAINLIIANDFIKWIANDVFGGDWQGITWRADWVSQIDKMSFANGGIVGEVWQMNEYGNPEMLYSANNGNTAVITQAQLAQAFEEAIYRTGIIQAIEDDKYIVIDGKAIAQSSSFKRELNRTNPKLGLK